jgi:hypothetical protein
MDVKRPSDQRLDQDPPCEHRDDGAELSEDQRPEPRAEVGEEPRSEAGTPAAPRPAPSNARSKARGSQ